VSITLAKTEAGGLFLFFAYGRNMYSIAGWGKYFVCKKTRNNQGIMFDNDAVGMMNDGIDG
jgi:hypothetical protein